jgi:hypothetical protein
MPPEKKDPDQDEAERLVTLLVKALNVNVSVIDLPAERREETAMEFVTFLGRLVELIEGQHPSPARAAALLFVVESLQFDKMTPGRLKIAVTLVEGAKRVHLLARDAREKKGAS